MIRIILLNKVHKTELLFLSAFNIFYYLSAKQQDILVKNSLLSFNINRSYTLVLRRLRLLNCMKF